MDNFELKTPVQPDGSDLQKQVDQLRLLTVLILILVIVVSGTFNLYLRRQQTSSRNQLAATRTMIADYQKVRGPKIGDFVKQLADFGRTHPDFALLLTKYGIKPAGPTSTPPAALSLPPAAAPKK
jgi:hypothetical protein